MSDRSEAADRLLRANEESRASVGLSLVTDLSDLQVAALYDPDMAHRMLADGADCDLHSASALGLVDEIHRLYTADSMALQADLLPPIGFALIKQQRQSLEALLEDGADPNQTMPRIGFFVWEIDALGEGEWHPIHAAATHGYAEIAPRLIHSLVKYGADIHAPSILGEQAIHLAATYGWLDVLNELLDTDADVNARTIACSEKVHELSAPSDTPADCDVTPLMVACRESAFAAARLLIERGADVGASSTRQSTALHFACDAWWGENVDVVEFLLNAGADRNAVDIDGKKPIDYAYARKYEGIVAKVTGTAV